MANIKITVDGLLMDGHKITFKAPCNCDVVEKLNVLYVEDGTQKNRLFTMKDSHGNDLTGLGNLFFEGAYVNVVLDTVNDFAYLQNADTNGYIEGRLGGFKFYNNPSLVHKVENNLLYYDENNSCVLADSATGAALLADTETYCSLTVEGNYYSIGGADTVNPFSGGGILERGTHIIDVTASGENSGLITLGRRYDSPPTIFLRVSSVRPLEDVSEDELEWIDEGSIYVMSYPSGPSGCIFGVKNKSQFKLEATLEWVALK